MDGTAAGATLFVEGVEASGQHGPRFGHRRALRMAGAGAKTALQLAAGGASSVVGGVLQGGASVLGGASSENSGKALALAGAGRDVVVVSEW